MRAAVYTLGCKLNQCESEALASSFDSRGFFIGQVRDNADIYIINTCTVTSKAEQKARRMIRKLSGEHPDSIILVTGCYAQLDGDKLIFGENVIIVPHDRKDKLNLLPEYLNNLDSLSLLDAAREFFNPASESVPSPGTASPVKKVSSPDPDRFWYDSVDFNYHTRAFLKVQDGCDNSCAYCRVTIARGDSVSLDVDSVLSQFDALQRKGYREIVLTGVNLTSYNSRGVDFAELLNKLTALTDAAPKPARIRISSLEPETIDERMAQAVSHQSVCPHFHISVQSGSDKILTAMRRHNNSKKIEDAVKLLRSVKDDPFLAADVIAGFPGETNVDFEETRSLLEQCDFTHLHVFPFSPRPDTIAATMKHPVPERVAGERTSVLRKLSEVNFRNYTSRWIGKEIDVLLEDKKGGHWIGTSGNYLKSEVCDIIKDEGLCRTVVESVSDDLIGCRFVKWL